MSKWTNATLTADGQNLQAQLLDGGGFEFTKVTAADSSGTDKLTLTMQPSVIDGKTITVPVLLSNSNLSAGFTMNQLKFYARKTGIPAGDEIVYAIAEDETGDEIPSESDSPGFTIDWSYTFQFGNATSVNVSIDPAGLVSMALLGNPGGIATLNNAGAVPIEQGGTGAVTASAALAALGGMRASATGDDIPTSASDPTSISSQLSNKVDNGSIGIPGDDCNNLENFGLYRVQTTTANCPVPAILGDTLINAPWDENTIFQLFFGVSVGKIFWRRRIHISENPWSNWFPLANATPPQEFDLPLAEGLEPIEPCRYSKDQFGRVLVNIDCTPTTGSVSIGENQSLSIGTLPEGFRPAHYTSNACEVIVGQSRYIGTFDINEYGAITLWTAAPSASIIIGSVLFDTA